MKKELTLNDMKTYLKTRKGKKFYFKFPDVSNTLILDFTDQIPEGKFDPHDKTLKTVLFQHAWLEYQRYHNFRIG